MYRLFVTPYLLLASSAGDPDRGLLVCVFSAIRQKALGNVEMYKSIVLVLVSLILVFKVVKHSYTIMSDEQSGGFSGIRLWDILRPLVLVLVLQSCSLFVSLFDSAVETVTMAIYRSVDEQTKCAAVSTGALIDKFELDGKTYSLKTRSDAKVIANAATQSAIDSTQAQIDNVWANIALPKFNAGWNMNSSVTISDEQKAELARLNAELKELEDTQGTLQEALIEYVDGMEESSKPRSWSLAGVMWLYDRIIVVVIVVADMILCCFILFLPIVLALSIFDFWKGSLKTWVGTYIEVSLWKVTAAVINWFVINARGVSLKMLLDGNLSSAKAMTQNLTSGNYTNSGTAVLVFICISLAGVIALFKVPSITSSILSLGKSVGDLGLVASTVTAPMKTASGASKMGSQLVSGSGSSSGSSSAPTAPSSGSTSN